MIEADTVLSYWQSKTGVHLRSEKVKEAYLKRIRCRLQEGFSANDLCRCVDVACWDEFYLKNGYQKQPEVIWRNAERATRLLAIAQHEADRPLPL